MSGVQLAGGSTASAGTAAQIEVPDASARIINSALFPYVPNVPAAALDAVAKPIVMDIAAGAQASAVAADDEVCSKAVCGGLTSTQAGTASANARAGVWAHLGSASSPVGVHAVASVTASAHASVAAAATKASA